jgi:diguanylate cyclase (GGDEF)-like protein
MVDANERIIVFNARFAQLFCLDETVRPGTTLNGLLAQAEASQWEGVAALRQIFADQHELIRYHRQSSFIQEMDDGRTFAVSHQPMSGGGWVATYEDITERRRAESQIAYMAHHDALTDLANRVLFREQMEQALAGAQRQGKAVAILCLDLDRFKDVNDSLGHETGDALLRMVAERLRACVRSDDIVARLGGDEFAVLQVGVEDPHECASLATRIVDAIGNPYELEGQEIVIGTSVGIALATDEGVSPDQLLKHADLALYRAKADGRSTFRFFEPEMDAQLQARRAMEGDLRKALANREFELYYQPQINIRANEISGFEALLRWRHPERGIISPVEFIPIAEDIGLIATLGEWVIEQACREASSWPNGIKVAVNLSPVQFRFRGLVQSVGRALLQSGLASNRLELEITESVLLQDNDMTIATLHQLRRLGVRIAMDDFGTGYSSLSYLRSFPFDKIKIDQSFVRELSSRADCLAIVQSIASLGANLGMSTVAEGVETEDQFQQIRAAGCTEVQGYYFGRPKPTHELVHTLAALRHAAVA